MARVFKTYEGIKSASLEALIAVPDIGDIVAQSVIDFFSHKDYMDVVQRLFDAGVAPQQVADDIEQNAHINGKTFVLTGTLPSLKRSEAQAMIEKAGGSVSASVSKNTDFVLAGESAGSKLIKARGLGVAVIDEETFLSWF